jgi:peptide/nickel transport system permease protein
MIKSPLKNKKDIVFVEDSLIGNESQLKLILMKFKKHKLAEFSFTVIIILYILALFSEFFQTQDPFERKVKYTLAPPQRIHFIDIDENGKKRIKPHVYDYMVEIDLKMARKIFLPDESKKNYIRFWENQPPIN